MTTATYVIQLTQDQAAKLERMLGGRIEIVPSRGPLEDAEAGPGAVLASLDGVTGAEVIQLFASRNDRRPVYHAGGPAG